MRSGSSVRRPRVEAATEDRGLGLADAHIKFRIDINPHPVLCDQGIFLFTGQCHLQRVHVHWRDVMDDRPDERAAVDHHFLAEETGADKEPLPLSSADKASASPNTG